MLYYFVNENCHTTALISFINLTSRDTITEMYVERANYIPIRSVSYEIYDAWIIINATLLLELFFYIFVHMYACFCLHYILVVKIVQYWFIILFFTYKSESTTTNRLQWFLMFVVMWLMLKILALIQNVSLDHWSYYPSPTTDRQLKTELCFPLELGY